MGSLQHESYNQTALGKELEESWYYSKPIDPSNWVGLKKTPEGVPLLENLRVGE